jgi:hypothetical protein
MAPAADGVANTGTFLNAQHASTFPSRYTRLQ